MTGIGLPRSARRSSEPRTAASGPASSQPSCSRSWSGLRSGRISGPVRCPCNRTKPRSSSRGCLRSSDPARPRSSPRAVSRLTAATGRGWPLLGPRHDRRPKAVPRIARGPERSRGLVSKCGGNASVHSRRVSGTSLLPREDRTGLVLRTSDDPRVSFRVAVSIGLAMSRPPVCIMRQRRNLASTEKSHGGRVSRGSTDQKIPVETTGTTARSGEPGR